MNARNVTLGILLLLLAPALAAAQPPERLRDRARTFLVLRLTDALGLDDATALRVSGVFRASEEERRKLETEREALEKEIRDVLSAAAPDRDALGALVDRAAAIDEKLALVPARSFTELRKILTPEQQAKLVLARPQIQREVRGAMRRRLELREAMRTGQPPVPGPRAGNGERRTPVE